MHAHTLALALTRSFIRTPPLVCTHTLLQQEQEHQQQNQQSVLEANGSAGGGGGSRKSAGCDTVSVSDAELIFFEKFNLGHATRQAMEHVPMDRVHLTTPVPPHILPTAAGAGTGAGSGAAGLRGGVTHFSWEVLCKATKDFEKRLGGGGCGCVFQGILSSGTRVAVKRLEVDPVVGLAGVVLLDQMQTEVQVLSQVQHPNIVQLLGSSTDGAVPCLVYALMEGGSLQDRLACSVGDVAHAALTSNERILVLSDVARGLAFLHFEVQIIHRDVKSANVLLDRNLVGRIGDFGEDACFRTRTLCPCFCRFSLSRSLIRVPSLVL